MAREEKIKTLIEKARSLKGKPYVWGADINLDDPPGLDCSALVVISFRSIGINLNERRSSILQAAAPGQEITRFEDLQPGDLIFFDGKRGYYRCDLFNGQKIDIGHVAIYTGDGKIIHTAGVTGMVVEEELAEVLKQPYRKITYIKRYY